MLGAMTAPHCRRARRGFTLVELMVVLAIMAVLAAIAVPALRGYIARQRVEGVAQELVTDLRYLRSLQMQRNETVAIGFGSNTAVTCYVLYTLGNELGSCDCTRNGPACSTNVPGAQEELKVVRLPRSDGVSISANPTVLMVGRNNLPLNGVTLRTTVSSTLGGTVRVSTNAAMLPDLCSVSGPESTLKACPPPPP